MKQKIYQVDAFAEKLFEGNPAAICPLDEWLSDDLMQQIAAENNLSETAFFVKRAACYQLRWFTPLNEVNLCGHATLATAFIIVTELEDKSEEIIFETKSGQLKVSQNNGLYRMDFPSQPPSPCEIPEGLVAALGAEPKEIFSAEDFLVVYSSEDEIRDLKPNFNDLNGLPLRGVIVTAPSENYDFVSRWFGPNVGVDEDPVTGSAHTTLTPYWSKRLGKTSLRAKQISERGGELLCELEDDRVVISGRAVKYLEGEIEIS